MTPATVRGSGFMSPSRAMFLSLALCFLCPAASAQQNAPPKIIALRASRMLDVNSGSIVHDPVILIQDDKIRAAGTAVKFPLGRELWIWAMPLCCPGSSTAILI
jgi:hypothetical protein